MSLRKPRQASAALLLTVAVPFLSGATDLTSNREARLLAAHNRERYSADIPPLRWDPQLEQAAAQWGEHLKKTGQLAHAPPIAADGAGENLWAGTRGHYSPEEMVGMWADEKQHFKPGRFPSNSRTGRVEDVGHYTQLMWRNTAKIGCAVTQNSREEFLVCRYSRGGNVIGEEPF
jgi:hypothetical protein